jgi:hypothetical protein
MPPPLKWIHKGQSNEAHTNPPNYMCHFRMPEWPTWSRTQEIFKNEGTYDGQAHKAKNESRATGKSWHHVE